MKKNENKKKREFKPICIFKLLGILIILGLIGFGIYKLGCYFYIQMMLDVGG